MRIAVIDLLFSWPPHGGADVDVYHVARELQHLGHEMRIFVARESGLWERGQLSGTALPCPVEMLDFPEKGLTVEATSSRFKHAVDQYHPDIILLTQGYFLKPSLILTLSDYPVVSRCYAHETACHKDILRFRDGAPCPQAYAHTPEICRRCALTHLGPEIRSGLHTAWTREYLAAEAWSPQYYTDFYEAMRRLTAVIVTTDDMRGQVAGLCERVHIIPHGVDVERFAPATDRFEGKTPVVFVPGRLEDPAKGLSVLMAAGDLLAREGLDFEIRATLPEGHPCPPWLKAVGKRAFDDMPRAYREADICIVPSLWDEPFGIVALEAMAAGLPVCASRVGGLREIVRHEHTGFLFERGNAAQLAEALKLLLKHPEKRRQMGEAGRERAVRQYQWKHIVREYYPRLLDMGRSEHT